MIGWLFLAIAVVVNVFANLAFKHGMGQFTESGGGFFALLTQPWLWIGGISAGTLLAAFLTALIYLPLAVVYTTITTLAMVGITVASHLLYDEPLGPARLAGMACAVVGVALIAGSKQQSLV